MHGTSFPSSSSSSSSNGLKQQPIVHPPYPPPPPPPLASARPPSPQPLYDEAFQSNPDRIPEASDSGMYEETEVVCRLLVLAHCHMFTTIVFTIIMFNIYGFTFCTDDDFYLHIDLFIYLFFPFIKHLTHQFSIPPYMHLPVHPLLHPSAIHFPTYPSIGPPAHTALHRYIIHPYIRPSTTHLYICPSTQQSVRLSIHPYIYPFILP